MNLLPHIESFLREVGAGSVDIYNEFSLQHELGIFLRAHLPECKVEFERNVSHFGLSKHSLVKREIDITVQSPAGRSAVELKFPRNGQVPETMFSFCKDIAFLEQLTEAGFRSAYFLAVAEDKLFYSGPSVGIYSLFRARAPITGVIRKPTGKKDEEVTISGTYAASWESISGSMRSCLISVTRPTPRE